MSIFGQTSTPRMAESNEIRWKCSGQSFKTCTNLFYEFYLCLNDPDSDLNCFFLIKNVKKKEVI
jgi:hypothetical protein